MVLQLITRLITGEAGTYFVRMRRLAGLYAVMALFGLLTAIFLILALFIFLAETFGALPTALGFAGVFLLVFVVFWIMTIMVQRTPSRRADDRLQRDVASIAGVAALTNAPLLFRSIRRNKTLLLVPVAGATGFALWRAISNYRDRIR
ncbi:hypothetical protein GTW51_03220 [Aurantimonas aggregata]|uniref:Phage holin family protein n=1 Tax=Aurantimonas aggregata TaxID=2047720 RepID=A0A6L9MDJ5_9HYPH|nr:hypothetical protein [Aurantimonas aggregata]NDV85706.1 hypothetical protein [Aurantimonas aggregata]